MLSDCRQMIPNIVHSTIAYMRADVNSLRVRKGYNSNGETSSLRNQQTKFAISEWTLRHLCSCIRIFKTCKSHSVEIGHICLTTYVVSPQFLPYVRHNHLPPPPPPSTSTSVIPLNPSKPFGLPIDIFAVLLTNKREKKNACHVGVSPHTCLSRGE